MKAHFTYNFVEKAIIGSKAAINRANKGMNPEYTELKKMLAEYPTFSVQEKVIQKNKDKKTYHNLTFERMAEYINTQKDSEKRMKEFETVKVIAAAKGAKYPLTKKWFLETYKDYKEHEVTEEERKPLLEQVESASEYIAAMTTVSENNRAA